MTAARLDVSMIHMIHLGYCVKAGKSGPDSGPDWLTCSKSGAAVEAPFTTGCGLIHKRFTAGWELPRGASRGLNSQPSSQRDTHKWILITGCEVRPLNVQVETRKGILTTGCDDPFRVRPRVLRRACAALSEG